MGFDFFGLGAGKITLKLNKMNFGAGETIDGTAILKLKNPTKAKRFYVKLFAEKRVSKMRGGKQSYHTEKVFEFEQNLDGKKEYPTRPLEYTFSLKVPRDSSVGVTDERIKNVIGAISQVASVFGASTGTVKWYVEARLDMPLKFDVSKKIQINIG